MASIVWIGFKLGELFDFESRGQLTQNKKKLDVSETMDDKHPIALVTQSEKNGGVSGYLQPDEETTSKIKRNCLSYSMHFGLCFYHDYDFVLMDTHGSVFILKPKNNSLKKILDSSKQVNIFIARLITHVCHNDVYNYSWLPNSSRVSREIILLPCEEVSIDDEYIIRNESGKFYNLAVDYINQLTDHAKILKESETINRYIKEKKMYESKCANYESDYLKIKEKIRWVGFKLGDLFNYVTGRDSTIAQKNLVYSNEKNEDFSIAIVTESKTNNGVGFYMKKDDPILDGKIRCNSLTIGTQFGSCNYHNYPYFIIGNTNYLVGKTGLLQTLIGKDEYVGSFFAGCINYIFSKSGLYGYNNKIDKFSFAREIILLPCIETNLDENAFYSSDKKTYNLAVDYIDYIYLKSCLRFYDKLIEGYKYEY